METSPLPAKGCNCLPMLCTNGQRAVRVHQRATPTLTSVYNGHLRGPVTLTPLAEHLVSLSVSVAAGIHSNIQTSAFEANAPTDCATASAKIRMTYNDYYFSRMHSGET